MRLFLWLFSHLSTQAASLPPRDAGAREMFAQAPPPPAHDEIVTHQVRHFNDPRASL
eukprot:COSAG02_NODE_37783_length_437_cov_1.218935_1_plen_56_part_10